MGYSADEMAVVEASVVTCLEATSRLEIQFAICAAMLMAAKHQEKQPDYYTFRDLEARWSLERKAIDRLPIPRTKIGNSIRFAAAAVAAYEDARRAYPE